MTAEDFRGEWEGRISGTNQGRIRLRLTPVPSGLVVEVRLDDDVRGSSYLIGTGAVTDDQLRATLSARETEALQEFGTLTVEARFAADRRLSGQWQTSVGTSGTFEASLSTQVAAPTPSLPAVSRVGFFEKQSRIRTCVVNLDVLKRLHAILRAGAEHAAELHDRKQYAPIAGGPTELARLYRVSLLVRGAQGEVTITDDPASLEADALPQPLSSVEFEIGLNYRLATSNQAYNRVLVRLDFTRPPALDFSNPSGSPTPNQSNIGVFGADPFWVAGIFERVYALLRQGAVRASWLHLSYTYDVLLVVVGLPLAFSLGVLAASHVMVPTDLNGPVFRGAIGLFTAVVVLVLFRLAFGLARWLLPYLEYAPSPEPLHRRVRLFFAGALLAVLTGVLGSALWEILK